MIRHGLKAIAVVLIILPEPITTALGIALLSIMVAFSFQKRLSKFGDLEELVNRSLKSRKLNEPSLALFKERTSVFHELKMGLSPLADGLEKNLPVFQPGSWFDNRKVSEKVLHHTLRTSLPQYEASIVKVKNGDAKSNSAGKGLITRLHTLAKA
jgi:hypothetical protein